MRSSTGSRSTTCTGRSSPADSHVGKVELIHHAFHVPPELLDRRLTDLAIGGVKLLAVRAPG